MKVLKKALAGIGLIPSGVLIFFGGYNLVMVGLQQILSDFIDFTNFSLVNIFNPFTSFGGSGTFLDRLFAGPGASGGSAVRYWIFMAYGLISVIGWTIYSSCWKVLKNEK
jgi:hypothetical protein